MALDPYRTIIRPVITEKTTHLAQTSGKRHGGTYTFEVHPDANKYEIRDAIEKLYGVKVVKVRTLTRLGKLRRFRYNVGRMKTTKRAVVTLDPNSAIDLF